MDRVTTAFFFGLNDRKWHLERRQTDGRGQLVNEKRQLITMYLITH